MARQVAFSGITNQQTLTESADARTENILETRTLLLDPEVSSDTV
jgi:hypothetical protein